MDEISKESLELHRRAKGKFNILPSVDIKNKKDLSLCYTPGVAQACKEIEADKSQSYALTRRWNLCAVITDGTAVLGLGDIGPEASMPVMEGKCALFKRFGDVDAFPICIDTKDTDEFVNTVRNISKSFGGINLEDISAPRCFEIERKLREVCDIPVFHDDQHGTSIVVLAGLINALKIVGKKKEDLKAVISGTGAAGVAICKILQGFGIREIIMLDSAGAIFKGRDGLNWIKKEIAEETNRGKVSGGLADCIKGADVFVGVSKGGLLTKEMVATMNKDAIIFALANPTPEIFPDEAKAGGAAIVATGRSDYPNQINNVLAFPGVFRGLFDYHIPQVTEEMKVRAAQALADVVAPEQLSPDYIIPDPFDENACAAVAKSFETCQTS